MYACIRLVHPKLDTLAVYSVILLAQLRKIRADARSYLPFISVDKKGVIKRGAEVYVDKKSGFTLGMKIEHLEQGVFGEISE